MMGHIYFQTLSAAVELDLFTRLDRQNGLSRSQISKRLNIRHKPIRILLSGLSALGLIYRRGEKYHNTPLSKIYLSRESQKSFAPLVRWQHHINYKPMFRFLDALKSNKNVGLDELPGSGKTLYKKLTHTPFLEKIFQEAMESISAQANSLLVEHLNLSKTKFLVDIGGGNGANIISLAQKNPHLKAAIFDSPSVCKIALMNIKKNKLQDRLHAIQGDCFKNNFPKEADTLMFCHFLTIYSEAKNLRILKNAYNTLPKGGKVIIFNMMQNDNESGPISTAGGSPYFLTLATGEGMLYTWKEYENWLRKAGFKKLRRLRLPIDHGVIVAEK